jgi:hypothetical protein
MEEWAIISSLDPYNICTVHATLSVLCTPMLIYSHYHYQLPVAFLTHWQYRTGDTESSAIECGSPLQTSSS